MTFYADLHIHSKYSRATSKNCDLENLAYWARKKGIAVVGTGDFTHPAWRAELADKLVPAEPGLFRLRDDIERRVKERLQPACRGVTRFMLSVEISTIYKKGDKVRKVHHLLYAPDFAGVDAIIARLARIGNLAADGRPILGLDSRHLLEITLEGGPGCYLVPAHVWTPWFAVLGSKSGFDQVAECYGDLADHIFAIETGLSSDPEMNWRLSQLDRYSLVSNSDAHSPAKLGREACRFDCAMDYFAMRRALETRRGFAGTVEFFPEEGKYHLDGHRKCGVVFAPDETRAHGGLCPVCKKPVTIGVMHRVQELADRPQGFVLEGASPYRCLVPLPEVIAELVGTGAGSKAVARGYEDMLARLGDEFFILEHAPLEDLARQASPQMAEAVARMRAGKVIRTPGYDGEYGVIRVFEDGELKRAPQVSLALPLAGLEPRPAPGTASDPARPGPAAEAPDTRDTGPDGDDSDDKNDDKNDDKEDDSAGGTDCDQGAGDERDMSPHLAALDPDQRAAAQVVAGPLLIVAGPGTGKTRTLTHRIAHIIADHGAAPESCLAVTFTNRAARELVERLEALLPDVGARVPVMTFHGLALAILRENRQACGLHRGFAVAADDERAALLAHALSCPESKARRLLGTISAVKRKAAAPAGEHEPASEPAPPAGEIADALCAYTAAMDEASLIDFDDLVIKANELLRDDAALRAHYRARWAWISIDEYQDIDELQYALIRHLCPAAGNLCAIGDPDQAIYGFRGADVAFFLRFARSYPGAREVRLTRNYRSTATIVKAALQAIGPATLVTDRRLLPRSGSGALIELTETATERAEAELVVHTIESLVGGTSFFSLDSGRSGGTAHAELDFSDFAVLYRTAAQADVLAEALSRSGIPFHCRAHARLAELAGVTALVKVMERTGEASGAQPLAVRLQQAVDALAGAAEGDAALLAARDLILPLAARCGHDMDAFAAAIACGVEMDTWDPRADRVSLLTLHAAKGLEFRVVFLVGCEDGIIPLRWGKEDEQEFMDEERRLFFVGLTRAREFLYLSRARTRVRRGKKLETELSPFVRDIATELLSEQNIRGRKSPGRATQLGLF